MCVLSNPTPLYSDIVSCTKNVFSYLNILGPFSCPFECQNIEVSLYNNYVYVHVLCRNETVQILDNYTHPDSDDVFEREPYVVLVRDLTERRM